MEIYTAIVIIACLSMLVASFSVAGNGYMNQSMKIRFCAIFAFLVLTNLSEWNYANLADESLSWTGVRVASKFIEMVLTPLIPLLIVYTISEDKRIWWALIPVAVNLIIQIISLFTGWVFSIDPTTGVYTRGVLYYSYVAIYVLEILFLFVNIYILSRRYQHHGIGFLIAIGALVAVAIIFQIVWSDLRLDWTCISIGMILFYVYYNSLVSQVDPLTGLFNRRCLDVRKNSIRNPAVLIFLDVDYFKEVNDDYGHQFGDTCLSEITTCLKKVYGKYGDSYRYGGDEFCVIMRKGFVEVNDINREFVREIEKAHAIEKRLPKVSFGFTLYDPTKETIDEALERADQLMYQQKRTKKSEGDNQPAAPKTN